ncbi:hypothetical protein HDU84_005520 [Entophlyctis sp. JEL0112]|nr:hypothetical protein HDU84_005520 [Entophlyctis sp. JEL0112]
MGKWDNIVASSDEDERLTGTPPPDLGLPKSLLLTIPWDPLCEEARWALTIHGVSFIEQSYPWPLQIFAVLDYSDPFPHRQQTQVPVFVNYKKEVYKRSTTDIFMFLYAHSFNTPLKIYSKPEALFLQEYFHKNLTLAVVKIYLHIILSSSYLCKKYLISTVHLNNLSAVLSTFWPIIRIAMHLYFDLSKSSIDKAWTTVEEAFDKVGELLDASSPQSKGGRHYIVAAQLTAADISFASHALLVLFPNSDEHGDSAVRGIGCAAAIPSLAEVPADAAARVRALRASRAGRHAFEMWRYERVYSSRPDENNPWWSKSNGLPLKLIVYASILCYTLAWIMVVVFARNSVFSFGFIQIVVAIAGFSAFFGGTAWEMRARQLFFNLRGRFEPTERDKVEAAQAAKDTENANVVLKSKKISS